MSLSRPSTTLLRPAASPHCRGVGSMRCCCSFLDVSCSSPSRLMCSSPTLVDARPPCGEEAGVQLTRMRLRSPTVQLPLLSVSPHCRRVMPVRWCLLGSRRVSLDVTAVNVRLSVGRGCVSLVADRTVMRLVVSRRGCSCVSPACSCRVRRWGCVMVLLLSRRLVFVSAAINGCPSVGQACRQPAPPTAHARCLSTSCRSSYPSTLTSVSCRR